MPVLTRFALATSLGLALFPAPAAAGENLMLVLDASGSMWGRIDGRSKVEIARETVAGVLAEWNPDNALGLVAYGHRRKGDCDDIETLIPVGPLDAAAYRRTVDGLNALGMTPLSAAVIHAAEALRSSEQKATVILVSDGEETCRLDPCAVGTQLEQAGVDFTAHVIGFDVGNPLHQAQLRCLAENTGGCYFNARDAAELGAAIAGAVSASTEPPLPPASATLIARGAATITQPLAIDWTGPADRGDYIAFAPVGAADGAYLDYAVLTPADATAGRGSVTLAAPAQAGAFELRYVSLRRTAPVLARAPIQVADAAASIEAPDEVVAGSLVRIRARGPVGGGHWVGFAPRGGDVGAYLAYGRLPAGEGEGEVELAAPAEPGDYELRFVLNEAERVLASRPIRVIAALASVSGPASAMAGDLVRVQARGPAEASHWIGFASAGSGPGDYFDYARPQGSVSELTLTAPSQAGRYELRYVLNEAEKVVAAQPITVTAAVARVEAPARVAAGSSVAVGFSGPRGNNAWVGFVPRGDDGGSYLAYFGVGADSVSPTELAAPEQPGSYDLIYFGAGAVLARQPVEVD